LILYSTNATPLLPVVESLAEASKLTGYGWGLG
jgi:hypothetical protein